MNFIIMIHEWKFNTRDLFSWFVMINIYIQYKIITNHEMIVITNNKKMG